ncbi:hypothetical protein [Microbacterium kunmingense]|uniref:hypothetical protein n=1 Tax=Microbacterium kunmingense TaxID=2915939 RepID=UPI003D73FFE8
MLASLVLVGAVAVGCASAAPTVVETVEVASSPTPAITVPEEVEAIAESALPAPEEIGPNYTDCTLPILDFEHAIEMAGLLSDYEGLNIPAEMYTADSVLNSLGTPSATATYVNTSEGRFLDVSTTVGPTSELIVDRVSTFEGYRNWQAELGRTAIELDAPGYTMAAELVHPDGAVKAEYVFIAGDRYLYVTFSNEVNVPASGAVASGMLEILCR